MSTVAATRAQQPTLPRLFGRHPQSGDDEVERPRRRPRAHNGDRPEVVAGRNQEETARPGNAASNGPRRHRRLTRTECEALRKSESWRWWMVIGESMSGRMLRSAYPAGDSQPGLSQQALADTAGTSQPTVAAYESGRVTPSLPTLNRLLSVCGYTIGVALANDPPRWTRVEQKSPAIHRLIAARLLQDPTPTLKKARNNLVKLRSLDRGNSERWSTNGTHSSTDQPTRSSPP